MEGYFVIFLKSINEKNGVGIWDSSRLSLLTMM